MVAHNVRRWSAVAVSSLALACSLFSDPKGGSQPSVLERLPRNLTTAETQVVSSANAFTFALFRQLSSAQPNENVFVSPLSASFSLGMTLNGARTGTFDAMRSTLQFGQTTQADINVGYRGIIDVLSDLDRSVSFEIANSIWYRNTMPVSPSFLDVARASFDAKAEGLDFANASASLATINGWVKDKTAGRIPTILDEIRGDHQMFLVNAIYFKGSWRTRFDPARTRSSAFTPAVGNEQTAQFMHRTGDIKYGSLDETTLVDLPYGNTAFSLTAVLPPRGMTVDAFTASLTQARWDALIATLHEGEGSISFPKLKIEYERTLNDDLIALGMGVAFGGAADFSGLTTSPNGLAIDFVKQKTFVEIDEEGTEAAAVTVTAVAESAGPGSFQFNRPFLFAIRERLTGTVLFIGKVNRIP